MRSGYVPPSFFNTHQTSANQRISSQVVFLFLVGVAVPHLIRNIYSLAITVRYIIPDVIDRPTAMPALPTLYALFEVIPHTLSFIALFLVARLSARDPAPSASGPQPGPYTNTNTNNTVTPTPSTPAPAPGMSYVPVQDNKFQNPTPSPSPGPMQSPLQPPLQPPPAGTQWVLQPVPQQSPQQPNYTSPTPYGGYSPHPPATELSYEDSAVSAPSYQPPSSTAGTTAGGPPPQQLP